MISTRWDPGISEVYEDWIWESSINLRWIVNQGFGFGETARKGKFYGNGEEIIWGFWALRMRMCGEIDLEYINSGRFGLVTVQGLLEDQGELDDEDVMEMDEIKAHLLENGIDMDAEDFLENLSEEEAEEVIKGHEEGSNDREEEEMVSVEEEKGLLALESDIPQQGHDRYDGIFIDWNMDCGGAVSLFSGIMIYSIDQSRCQQWGRGAAALKRRIAVRSINGVEFFFSSLNLEYGCFGLEFV
ncbi:hypothetical protein HID58_047849 [Brassica napus]|uniref:Uncharacterized protein n=1 Tax=Brassica napus TaxID=3708 RepID=A0ABQ8B1Y3_BRANA|nr:hypothetical protein HID58_047849 [Brassica napus]